MPLKNKKTKLRSSVIFALITLTMLIVFGSSVAQIKKIKSSINNGGSTISGGNFVIKSTIGQIDASSILTGENFKVNGGFWHPLTETENLELIFKNGFE